MKIQVSIRNTVKAATLGAALIAGLAAHAATITVSYLGAGVQSQTGSSYNVETFNSGLGAGGTTTFGGSTITGTYSGSYVIDPANQYGGANGTGSYIWPPFSGSSSESYTLTLDTGVNYFGFWLSAQDPGDQLQIFDGSTLLYTFTAADLSAALGACPTASLYCGNPNAPAGRVTESNYAFVQFYLDGATFDKLVFTELNPNNGFESDNHTIANLTSAPTGTVLSTTQVGSTPEPSSLILLGTGVLSIAGGIRRKMMR